MKLHLSLAMQLMICGAMVYLLPLLPLKPAVAAVVGRVATLGLVVFAVAFAVWLGL